MRVRSKASYPNLGGRLLPMVISLAAAVSLAGCAALSEAVQRPAPEPKIEPLAPIQKVGGPAEIPASIERCLTKEPPEAETADAREKALLTDINQRRNCARLLFAWHRERVAAAAPAAAATPEKKAPVKARSKATWE